MNEAMLDKVLEAVTQLGGYSLWGFVVYLMAWLLLSLSLAKLGLGFYVVNLLYKAVKYIANMLAGNGFSDDYLEYVRNQYHIGSPGILTDGERQRTLDMIRSTVEKDLAARRQNNAE